MHRAGDEAASGVGDTHAPTEPAAMVPWIEQLLEQVEQLEERRQQSLTELQEAAVELATIIAEHITQRAIAADQFDLYGVARRVVRRCFGQEELTLRLHPLDLVQLEQQMKSVMEDPWAGRAVRMLADATLERGTCRAEGVDFGCVWTLKEHMDEVRETLRETLDDAQTERRQAQPGGRNLRRVPDRRETA